MTALLFYLIKFYISFTYIQGSNANYKFFKKIKNLFISCLEILSNLALQFEFFNLSIKLFFWAYRYLKILHPYLKKSKFLQLI
jgi:hypothetical protein